MKEIYKDYSQSGKANKNMHHITSHYDYREVYIPLTLHKIQSIILLYTFYCNLLPTRYDTQISFPLP